MPVLRHALPARRRSEGRSLIVSPDDRVLIVAPSWVGDAILSEPLVARLRERGVTQPIDVLAPPWCAPVYARIEGIGRILDNPAAHGEFAVLRRRALGRSLSDTRYTHAYVLPNTWKSALVPFFARIPQRIGYVGEARYGLLTQARKLDRRALPRLVERYAALADERGAEVRPASSPRLVPDAINREAAMRALGLTTKQPVAILCPGAEFGPAKRWPAEHFAALAKRLATDGFALWILGSPNDRAQATAVIEAVDEISHDSAPSPRARGEGCGEGRIVDLTGRTDLGTAIDLLSIASLVVSNDSGLMHAAAAVGAPLVALYGSSSPLYTPPLSASARIAKIDIVCSPCFKRECPLGHFRCMRDLSPEMVYNLARTPAASAADPPQSPR